MEARSSDALPDEDKECSVEQGRNRLVTAPCITAETDRGPEVEI